MWLVGQLGVIIQVLHTVSHSYHWNFAVAQLFHPLIFVRYYYLISIYVYLLSCHLYAKHFCIIIALIQSQSCTHLHSEHIYFFLSYYSILCPFNSTLYFIPPYILFSFPYHPPLSHLSPPLFFIHSLPLTLFLPYQSPLPLSTHTPPSPGFCL